MTMQPVGGEMLLLAARAFAASLRPAHWPPGATLKEAMRGQVYALMVGSAVVGFVVLQVEAGAAWIGAAVARVPRLKVAREVIAACEAIAAGQGARTIGLKTIRPGLVRIVGALGYVPAGENEYTKGLQCSPT